MVIDQSEYNKLVIAEFEKKKAQKKLSLLLASSTRSSIKKACVNRYNERDSERDDQLLRDFFGPAESGRQCLQLIENCNVEKFRTLNNYLRKDTNSTDNLNVELIAWLIDFKYRPFSEGNNLELNKEEKEFLDKEDFQPGPGDKNVMDETGDGKDSTGEDIEEGKEQPGDTGSKTEEKPKEPVVVIEPVEQPPAPPVEPTPPGPPQTPTIGFWKKYKKVALTLSTFLITGTAVILYGKMDAIPEIPLGGTIQPEECMYWNGDQYEPASCAKAGTVKMNREKMKTFKRIRDQKKITEELIGIVHYIKDGEIKYYTGGGPYPDDTSRVLKKLSRYMYDKYIRNKDSTDKKLLAERK